MNQTRPPYPPGFIEPEFPYLNDGHPYPKYARAYARANAKIRKVVIRAKLKEHNLEEAKLTGVSSKKRKYLTPIEYEALEDHRRQILFYKGRVADRAARSKIKALSSSNPSSNPIPPKLD